MANIYTGILVFKIVATNFLLTITNCLFEGGVAIPGACIGIVAGGFLVKKFKIDPKGAALMAISCNIICLFGIIVLIFTGCPNIIMAGTTVAYPNTNTY